ncbi:MAG TPA: hypothetical protein EYP68_07260 [Candidatus Korarchaeota archaeon]|nr:hypothetical protein [Candidatus Korarchaeota archaeon]
MVIVALAFSALIVPDKEIISGNFGGSIETIELPKHIMELDNWLRSERGDFRVAFFPPACWAARYDWSENWFLDPIVSLQAKPTVEIRSEMDITPSNNFVKWAYMAFYSKKTNKIGRILGILGVKYVIYRPDVDMPDERVDLRQLGKEETVPLFRGENDLLLFKKIGEYEVYLNQYALPLMVEGIRPILIVGDRKTLISLSHLDLNFSENGCLFLDNLYDYPGLEELVRDSGYIIIDPTKWIDLQLALSKEKIVIKPWESVEMSTDALNRWIRGDFSWYLYEGTLNVAPDNYVMTNGSGNAVSIPLTIPKGGNYTLLVQCFTTSREGFGQISIKLDDFPQKLVQTKVLGEIDGYYRWVEVGEFYLTKGTHYLTFRSVDGATAISKIVLLPEDLSFTSITMDSILPPIALLMDDDFWNFDGSPDAFAISPKFSNGKAIYLGNRTVYGSFYIPRGGEYSLILKVYGRMGDTLQISLDDAKYSIRVKGRKLVLRSLNISKGMHTIEIVSNNSCLLDLALIVEEGKGPELPLLGKSGGLAVVPPVYLRSRCSLDLKVNSSYLLFLETYEPGWRLLCEEEIEPLMAFSYANLYLITEIPEKNCRLTFIGCKLVWEGLFIGLMLLTIMVLSIMSFKNTELMRGE